MPNARVLTSSERLLTPAVTAGRALHTSLAPLIAPSHLARPPTGHLWHNPMPTTPTPSLGHQFPGLTHAEERSSNTTSCCVPAPPRIRARHDSTRVCPPTPHAGHQPPRPPLLLHHQQRGAVGGRAQGCGASLQHGQHQVLGHPCIKKMGCPWVEGMLVCVTTCLDQRGALGLKEHC